MITLMKKETSTRRLMRKGEKMNKEEKTKVKDAVELLDEAYDVSKFLPTQILEAKHVLLSLL